MKSLYDNCKGLCHNEKSLHHNDEGLFHNGKSLHDQWLDPGWGIWGKFTPSRNCIQDRDTLLEQSITLIKQSQLKP